VALDGKPIPMRSLVAYSRGGAALQLTMSNYGLGCGDLKGSGTLKEPDEITIDLTIAPHLTPDGNDAWEVTRARVGRITRQGTLGKATVTAYDPREIVRAKFKAEVQMPATKPGSKSSKLVINADMKAEGCGILPLNSKAEVRQQNKLEVELAGKRIKIHGASLYVAPDGRRQLRLTSEPHACNTGVHGSDYGITLELPVEGDHATMVRVEGYALSRTLVAKLDEGAMAARFLPAVDDSIPVAGEIAGEAKPGGYELKISGTASLQTCREQAPPR
jgi:hypothetical protein